MTDSISTLVTIVGGIVTIIATLIGGLYAFITKTAPGQRFWVWFQDLCVKLFRFLVLHRVPVIILIIVLVVVLISALTYRICCSIKTKTIVGNIYYKPCGNSTGLYAVPDVTVHVSGHPDLKSQPSAHDGSFAVLGVPPDLQPTHLTAQYGGRDFSVPISSEGAYAIIERPCAEPRDIKQIETPWNEVTDECLAETELPTRTKQYVLEAWLSGSQGKKEALFTVELLNAVDITIVNAFVISPPRFYRNETVPGQDRTKAHTWAFDMPKDGLKVRLELCIGSNQSDAILSNQVFHTYYELR